MVFVFHELPNAYILIIICLLVVSRAEKIDNIKSTFDSNEYID